MRVRFRIDALVLAAFVAGCASGGGSSAPEPLAGMQEGTRPSDNDFTQNAQLYLLQAQGQEGTEAEARFAEALTAALGSVQAEPGNPLGYLLAGQAMIGTGDLVGADSMLARAEEIYPAYSLETPAIRESAWVEMYNDGIGLLQAGQQQEALDMFIDAGVIYDARPEAFIQVGSVASGLGQQDVAAEGFSSCLRVVQGDPPAEQTPEEAASWEEWEEICALNQAQAYRLDGDNQKAADAYASYLEVNPGSVNATTQLANSLALMASEGGPGAEAASDSAAKIYEGLMSRTDLDAREMFIVGIGLYQIEDFPRASRAFGKATEMNPKARDAAYNYAQTLFLSEDYPPLPDAARLLLELDPQSSNAHRLLAQGLLQTESSEVAMEVMAEMEALTFEVLDPVFQAVAGGGAQVTGDVQNNSLDQGTPISLRFHYVTVDGAEAGTTDVTVNAPAAESVVAFQTSFDSEMEIMGFWYEVVSP